MVGQLSNGFMVTGLNQRYRDGRPCYLKMNPGAAGRQGWHLTRTIILFTIDGAEMKDCNVIELGKR